MEFTFAPIYSLGRNGSDDKFDSTGLPFEVLPGLTIEDVGPLLTENAFDLWKPMLGESKFEKIGRVRFAFIYRQNTDESGSRHKESLTAYAASLLRLIRPMRCGVLTSAHGEIKEDGRFDLRRFELSERQTGVEVVEAHKLSTLRDEDAKSLRFLLPEFIRGIEGEFWKFRMAVQFHDLGYFQSYNWKPRFILWASALESIYTSHSRDHQGSRVAIARIKWFLGESTLIYSPQDWPSSIPSCSLNIGDVLDDLYDLRNFVAHGDKVPDSFFTTYPRIGINGGVCKAEVLSEASSFLIRASLLKILRAGLLDRFMDAGPAEEYFGAQDLVNSKLR